MTDHPFTDREPPHAESSTASLLTELQLYGHRPFQDEPDARPLPEERTVRTALADIFDALVSTFTDTRMEPDLEDLLWSAVNLFHRAGDRVERELDSNEQAQRRSQKEQDGSEIRSVDRVHGKHPGMVLLHGGSPKGAERIAACWADARKVPQVAFKPDFTRHKNAAPFKRNDQLLDVLPIGVVVFPGSGISDNLADKARKLGIPLFDFRKGGGA